MKIKIITLKGEAAALVSDYKLIQSRGEKFNRDPKAIESHGFSGRKNKERVVEESLIKKNTALLAVKKIEIDIKKKKKQKKQKKKTLVRRCITSICRGGIETNDREMD